MKNGSTAVYNWKPWILVNTHLLTRERTLNQEHKSDYSVSLHFKPSNFHFVTNSLASAYRWERKWHVGTGKTVKPMTHRWERQGSSTGQEMKRKWPLTVDQEIHYRFSDWSRNKFEFHFDLKQIKPDFKGRANGKFRKPEFQLKKCHFGQKSWISRRWIPEFLFSLKFEYPKIRTSHDFYDVPGIGNFEPDVKITKILFRKNFEKFKIHWDNSESSFIMVSDFFPKIGNSG